MTVRLEPKYSVQVERNLMIPMRDGTRLAADVFRPETEGRFPVILEYRPYRKDDAGRYRLDAHYYFAERGFVSLWLDVRGTGGSEGITTDEYVPQEQEDGYDAVEWLARQPWSNGNVGMYGTSYSGFTAVQVAMHQPPHLKAIVPIYATDDRYTDDCHYSRGGNMRMYYDVGTYGGTMVAMNALPPSPESTGAQWAEIWKQRLEQNEPYLLKWMHHQVDGPYWRSASLRPNYDRIQCPVFLIGGWHDGYSNAMLRMYQHLGVPKKLLMGPWQHDRPHTSVPGPRIDYLNEVARFFAHWLKGEDTGIVQEPKMTVYMQEYAKPDRTLDIIPGHWRHEADFPVAGTTELTFYLQENGRLADSAVATPHQPYDEYEYIPTVGSHNAYWSGGGLTFYLGDDQRSDEAYSLIFTTPPFHEAVRLLGWPRVILHASSTAQVATFVAKLADVAPDASSALITDGSLNGTRRQFLTDPAPMRPGEIYELDIPMTPTGWVIPPGHRLRLAVSSSDFPNLWPTPEKARNRIYHGQAYPSRLLLPVVPEAETSGPHFLPPPALRQVVKPYPRPSTQQITRDQISGTVTFSSQTSSTYELSDDHGKISIDNRFRCTASSKNPAQASVVGTHRFLLEGEVGVIEVSSETSIRATEDSFHILIDLNVTKNGRPLFLKTWTASEPRRLL